ncbi:MAG: hypothetical protein IT384_05640 [Deltaproteobacteria bacterium]|nr:hypothetical protein [Deltaproteobacteria bacterium]
MDAARQELLYLAIAILVMMSGLALLKRSSRQRGLDRFGKRRRVLRATPRPAEPPGPRD